MVAGIAPTGLKDIITHMKITETQLRKIIREEIKNNRLNEGFLDSLKSLGKKGGSGLPSVFAKVSDMYGQLEDQIQENLDLDLVTIVTKAVDKIQMMPGDEDPSSLLGFAKVFTTGTTEDLSVASRDLRSITEDLVWLKRKITLSKAAFREASELADEKPEEAMKIIKKAFQQYGGSKK